MVIYTTILSHEIEYFRQKIFTTNVFSFSYQSPYPSLIPVSLTQERMQGFSGGGGATIKFLGFWIYTRELVPELTTSHT